MAGKKVWTKEETLELICIYESSPEIWDSRHMHYKDRDKRNMCSQSMGEALNTSVAEVQWKIHNLRNQVSQELQKMAKRKGGSGVEEVYTSTWPYFSALKFIVPSLSPRESISNLVVPAEASEEVTENSGDGAEAAAPIPASSPKNKKKGKSGKTISSEDECLNQALNFMMRRLPDDFDTFREYVAMELRSLSSEMYRKMLKREICQSIARIAKLDDLNSLATCSTKITEALSPDP